MQITNFSFLFLFLPLALLLAFLTRKHLRAQNTALLALSLAFYACSGLRGLSVLLALSFAVWLLARLHGRGWQTLGIVVCIAVLCYFKYTGFLTDNWNRLTGLNAAIPMVAAPLGVSFFTFLAISYLADVRRGTIPAERSFGCLLLYFTFFPKAAQGPLMRYDGLASQLAQRRADLPTGIERFILGLGKKVLLAEAAGKIASQVFVLSAVALTPGKMWLGAICYALQIFFDFAGYTDMALGLGRMFGFALPENFNYPYLADSVTDFWRRWHMTLSQWFRDYVYIPLGGNRRGKARQILNLCIVWLLTGLWHGSAWTFVSWGAWYAALLILEKLFLGRWLQKAPKILRHIYALLAILIGWIIFNSPSLGAAGKYLRALCFLGEGTGADAPFFLLTLRQYGLQLAAALARAGLEGCAHRVADDDGLILALQVRGRLAVGERGDLGLLGEVLVGHARHGVLLVDDQGDAHGGSCAAHGDRDVGAKGQDVVWAVRPEERLGLGCRLEDLRSAGKKRPGLGGVEAGHLEALEVEAGLDGELGLDVVGRASEEDAVPAASQLVGHGDGGVDVAGRAAGRYNEVHGLAPGLRLRLRWMRCEYGLIS